MNYEKNDFLSCHINPFEDLKKPLESKKFKGLHDIKIEGKNQPEALLKYIICFYDRESPFRSISDIYNRKKACCKFVGLSYTDQNMTALLAGEDSGFCASVVYYVKEMGDRRFALLVIAESEFYKTLYKIQHNKLDGYKNAQSAFDEADHLDTKIRDYIKDVFLDPNEGIEEALGEEIGIDMDLLPEAYARDAEG